MPWVTTSLIDFNIISEAQEYITEEGLNNSSAKMFESGTLLLALYGQGVTRGKVALLGINATTNQACAAILFDKSIVYPKFAFYQLISKYETIRNLANDGGQKNLSGGLVKSLPISLPDLSEQKRLACFLSAVDKKIRLLKEKHVLLEQYKKGVMQKLFKQEIRFKNDSGTEFPDWKVRKFSEVLSLSLNPIDMDDDEQYELITVRRRNGGVVSRGHYKGSEVLVKTQFRLSASQFVISKRQIVHGACGIVPETLDGAIVSNEYNVFDVDADSLDVNFFNYYSMTKDMKRAYYINSDGVHIEKLLFKTKSWLKTLMPFPCIEEQKKIVSFIQILSSKIVSLENQIELTEKFKKGLLQKMFV